MSAIDIQVGGDHYKKLKIQPAQYNHANSIPWFEGEVIKYVTRWRDKGGIKDLEKARHVLELLIEMEHAGPEKVWQSAASQGGVIGGGLLPEQISGKMTRDDMRTIARAQWVAAGLPGQAYSSQAACLRGGNQC